MTNSEQLAQQLLEQISSASFKAVQAMLTQAYEDGYRDGQASCRSANPQPPVTADFEVVRMDLGLPSGTIWLRPKDTSIHGAMTIREAMQCGLKLPTMQQIQEFGRRNFEGVIVGKPYVRGVNFENFCLSEHGVPCTLIARSEAEGSDRSIHAWQMEVHNPSNTYIWTNGKHNLEEKVIPLFVL